MGVTFSCKPREYPWLARLYDMDGLLRYLLTFIYSPPNNSCSIDALQLRLVCKKFNSIFIAIHGVCFIFKKRHKYYCAFIEAATSLNYEMIKLFVDDDRTYNYEYAYKAASKAISECKSKAADNAFLRKPLQYHHFSYHDCYRDEYTLKIEKEHKKIIRMLEKCVVWERKKNSVEIVFSLKN